MLKTDINHKGKKSCNLAYIHTGIFPSNSPSTTFVVYNALGLSEVFTNVWLYVQNGSNESTAKVLDSGFGVHCPDNLHIIRLNGFITKTHMIYFIRICLHVLICRNSLSTIITRNISFVPYLAFLKRMLGIPVYLETHDFFTDLTLRDDKYTAVKARNCRLEKRYLPTLTGLICLQNAQKTLYKKYYPLLPIYVLRTGLPRVYETSNIPRKYMAYIGSFDRHKGLETLFSAAAISQSKPDVLLIGAKNAADFSYIKEIASRYAYLDKLVVKEWIGKAELHTLLQQVKIGIVPLVDTFFNRYITSPLKIFDYYSFGIPVLATDLPTTRELIDENETGFLFPADKTESMAACIDKLYADEELYQSIADHVYIKAHSLLWSQRALNLQTILGEQF